MVFLLIYDVHFMILLRLVGHVSSFFSIAIPLIKGLIILAEIVEGCVITCYLVLYLKY